MFKAHSIYFPETSPWLAELETELLGVTIDGFKSMFTDLADALAMQIQIAIPPARMREMSPRGHRLQEVEGYNPLIGNYDTLVTAQGDPFKT